MPFIRFQVIEGEEAICGNRNNITPQSDILFFRFSLIGPVPANVFPHDHVEKKNLILNKKRSRDNFEKRPEGIQADKQSLG